MKVSLCAHALLIPVLKVALQAPLQGRVEQLDRFAEYVALLEEPTQKMPAVLLEEPEPTKKIPVGPGLWQTVSQQTLSGGGGTSLSAVRLAIILNRAVSIKDVISHPILADLARLIDSRSELC
jgi:hypothetical protein